MQVEHDWMRLMRSSVRERTIDTQVQEQKNGAQRKEQAGRHDDMNF